MELILVVAGVLGGGVGVALVNGMFSRGKTTAETEVVRAEVTLTEANAEKTFSEASKTIGAAWKEVVSPLQDLVRFQEQRLVRMEDAEKIALAASKENGLRAEAAERAAAEANAKADKCEEHRVEDDEKMQRLIQRIEHLEATR